MISAKFNLAIIYLFIFLTSIIVIVVHQAVGSWGYN